MSLKKYSNFVNEEIDDFYNDLEASNKKLKLFTNFNKSNLKQEIGRASCRERV